MPRLFDRFVASNNKPRQLKPVLEILEDRCVLDAWGLNLDFGTSASGVGQGYLPVPVQKFDPITGYGWTDVSAISAVNRPDAKTSTLDRAFHTGQRGTFQIAVPNGDYQVTLRFGDPSGSTGPMFGILENRLIFSNTSTAPGQIIEKTYKVKVTDQQLSLLLTSRKSSSSGFALNSMKIFSNNVVKPSNIALQGTSILENRPAGTVVGTLSTTYPNAAGNRNSRITSTFTLVSGDGSADNAWFSIVGNKLVTNSNLDYEAQSTRSVRIRTTDTGGLSFEKVFTINVQNVNEAPTALSLSNSVLQKQPAAGTLVGLLTTTDPDRGDSFTYSLVTGMGSRNNDQFVVKEGSLVTGAALAAGSYSIRLRSTDAGGLFTEQAVVITVNDSNQAPTNITLTGSSILENNPVGTLVGSLSTTDPNTGDTFTYSLVNGTGSNDNSVFAISGNQLITNSILNYEAQPTRTVRIRTTDAGGSTFDKIFTINVQNVNEAPTAISLSNNVIPQNAPIGTTVGQLSTTDPDQGDSFTYSLVSGTGSTNNASFTIQGSSIKTTAALAAGTYSIRVRSADAGGLLTENAFTISTVDNSSPIVVLTSPTNNSTLSGTINLIATATDNVGVVGVQFMLNNQPLGAELTSGNFTYSWNTTQVSNGTHILAAKARDAAGNVTTSGFVTVTVSNPVDNDPLNKPVLNQGDFTYLGAFDMPLTANGWSTAFSTGGLTHRYVNGNLQFLTTSHVYSGGLVYEINYPGLNTNGEMPKASVIKNWGDVYTGNKWVGNDGGTSSLSGGVMTYGLYYDQNLNRLYWNYGHWYNASNPYNPSVGYSTLNDTTGVATGVGAWGLQDRGEKFSRGGTLRIPQWFADDYTGGKSLGVGFGGYFSIIGSGSLGPSLAAINDPDIVTEANRSSVDNIPLIGYPANAPGRAERNTNYTSYYDGGVYPSTPGNWNPSNGKGYWTWSDYIYGSASWIDTPSMGGVLYLARLGTGDVYYQTSNTHASGSVFEWMVYDPKDLAAVATGAKQQWQIQPKYRWIDSTLPVGPQDQNGFSGDGASNIGGITYDNTTGRLYVLVNASYQDGVEWYPRMYVYQVGAGAPNPTVLPATNYFQFGQNNAPTVSGYQKISKDNFYNPSTGYGWLIGTNWNVLNGNGTSFADQGTGTREGTFAVNLANGNYQVMIRLGRADYALDNMGIYLQGQLVDTLGSTAGQSLTRTYAVTVNNGLLRLRLSDLGGSTSEVVIQSLDVIRV